MAERMHDLDNGGYLSDEEAERAYRSLYQEEPPRRPGDRPPPQPRPRTPRKAPAKKLTPPTPARAVSRAGRRLARSRSGRSGASSRPGYFSRAFSPSAAADRTGASKLIGAGDGGGLLLALVLYPIGLSIIKYGAGGPGVWFKAKWLNQPTTPPDSSGSKTNPPVSTLPKNAPAGYQWWLPDGPRFWDRDGAYGPKGAEYPSGLHLSPSYLLNGKTIKNPNYQKAS